MKLVVGIETGTAQRQVFTWYLK